MEEQELKPDSLNRGCIDVRHEIDVAYEKLMKEREEKGMKPLHSELL